MVDVALRSSREPGSIRWPLTACSRDSTHSSLSIAPGKVDDRRRLKTLVELLLAIPMPAIPPLHIRTRRRLQEAAGLDHAEVDIQPLAVHRNRDNRPRVPGGSRPATARNVGGISPLMAIKVPSRSRTCASAPSSQWKES